MKQTIGEHVALFFLRTSNFEEKMKLTIGDALKKDNVFSLLRSLDIKTRKIIFVHKPLHYC